MAFQVEEVQEALLNSGEKLIVEAVRGDYYWSSGLDKKTAVTTDPDHWPGLNMMGKILMKIRKEMRDEMTTGGFTLVEYKNTLKRKISQESAMIRNNATKTKVNGITP